MKPFINTVLKYTFPVVQILLGFTFLFSGFVKVIDPVGSFIKVEDYLIAFGINLPRVMQYILAVGQGLLEFVLGTCVLLGIWKKEAAWLTFLFMSIMTPFTLYLAVAHPVSDCGCFGEAIKLTNWETFGKNILLLLFSYVLLRYNDRSPVLYGKRTSRWSVYWSLAFSLFLSIYGYRHQPVFDFMPFKVGNNLKTLTTSIPDSIDYQFLYEKGGQRKSFGTNNLPSSEEGWNYVDRTEVIVKEGKKPVIENLSILHPTQGDITERIITDTSYVFLYVSPTLEYANRSHVDEINQAYQYASQHNFAFYGLTASGKEAIDEWVYEYESSFDFCAADDKLLKTMIRSNPGLLLLKDGMVIRKWAFRDIPDFAQLDRPLSASRLGNPHTSTWLRVLGLLVLVFAFPLMYFHQLHTGKVAKWTHKRVTNNETV